MGLAWAIIDPEMMSPELREQLLEYGAACSEQLAGFQESHSR
jgi:hypothetical protein